MPSSGPAEAHRPSGRGLDSFPSPGYLPSGAVLSSSRSPGRRPPASREGRWKSFPGQRGRHRRRLHVRHISRGSRYTLYRRPRCPSSYLLGGLPDASESDDFPKPSISPVPLIGPDGFKGLDVDGFANERPSPPNRADLPQGQGLDHDVSEGGGLSRARNDRKEGGVGGELTEPLVPAASADQVEPVDRFPGETHELVECPAIFQGQALQDATHGLGRRQGRPLARAPAKSADGFGHARRVQEIRAVRVNKGPERRSFVRESGQLVIAKSPVRGPFLAALLQQPEAGDVLEKAGAAGDSSLVGEIGGEDIGVDQGGGQLPPT